MLLSSTSSSTAFSMGQPYRHSDKRTILDESWYNTLDVLVVFETLFLFVCSQCSCSRNF
jgi:hypothetical protein